MRNALKIMLAATALATASTASAADFLPGTSIPATPGNPSTSFQVTGDPFDGSVSGAFARTGLGSGTFTDRFLFTLGQNGLGSGSVTTSLSGAIGGVTDLDLLSVTFFNGTTNFVVPLAALGGAEFGALTNVAITNGVQNILTINYRSRGNGSYGGDLSFTPTAAVPEPAAWALMLFGFAGIGFSMRRRTKDNVRVKFAF